MMDSEKWRVLIVDDDKEVHTITRMVLSSFQVDNKSLSFFSAYSAAEAEEILLTEHDDVAVALVDVVMEKDDSGLSLIRTIREKMKNTLTRIILRTGQPGQAPERSVILEYDINDYREKTELNAEKLITSTVSAIRGYRDMRALRDLNDDLDQRVQERTKELANANEKLTENLKRLKEDQIAGAIAQRKLLPAPRAEIQGISCFNRFFPSMYLSGDMLDYFSLSENRIGFYIADVSGHGISSALVTILVKHTLDRQREQLKENSESMLYSPAKVLKFLAKELKGSLSEKFVTLIYGVVDTEKKRLITASAGHLPHIHLITGGESQYLEVTGSPVGMFPNADYKELSYSLKDDFSILCMTDGILELLEEPSLKMKMKHLEDLHHSKDTIEDIADSLGIRMGTHYPDDIAIMMLRASLEKSNG